MGNAGGTQLAAHHPRQRAGIGFADIGGDQAVGVQLVAGAHAADDGHAECRGPPDQTELGGDGIDGVHDAVERRKIDGIGIFRQVKYRIFGDRNGGVDIPQAGGHDRNLRLPQRGVQRHQLTVQVAFADGIVIDKGKRADAAAPQGFAAPAAHPAQAEHGDLFGGQGTDGLLAQQQGGAFKLRVHRAASCRLRTSFCWRISRPTKPYMV